MKNPKIPKFETNFYKRVYIWVKIKTQIWGQNGRYTGICENQRGGKMTKNAKMEKILNYVFEKMKTYLTIQYFGMIEYCYLDDIQCLMVEIEKFLKNAKIENVVKFKYGILTFDDYYCIVLYDENKNIIDFIIWDFDFDICNNELFKFDYRFSDCKNNDEILNKFDFVDFIKF